MEEKDGEYYKGHTKNYIMACNTPYVTIIGQPLNSTSSEKLRYVWATNDKEIEDKINTYSLNYGESEITHETVGVILSRLSNLDEQTKAKVHELSEKIEKATNEANSLYAQGTEEAADQAEYVSETVMTLRNKLDSDLLEISKQSTGSYPDFNASNLDFKNTDYIFYRPVLYRRGTSESGRPERPIRNLYGG